MLISSDAAPRLHQCLIQQNNLCGVICETAAPLLDGCTITHNKECGVRFTLIAQGRMNACTVTQNPIGLLVEQVAAPRVTNCSLGANTDWNVVLRSTEDLDLAGNWWGTRDLDAIRKTISTAQTPGAARASIDPPLAQPPGGTAAQEETP